MCNYVVVLHLCTNERERHRMGEIAEERDDATHAGTSCQISKEMLIGAVWVPQHDNFKDHRCILLFIYL